MGYLSPAAWLVADPAGSWGLAVVEAKSESDVRALSVDDPTVNSGMATFDVYCIPRAYSGIIIHVQKGD